MPIRKGTIYWVDISSKGNSKANGLSPGLVVQNDVLNSSKLNTVNILAITTNLKFGELPGNVVLDKGEANLPKPCVINVTRIKTVDKIRLRKEIGSLTEERMARVDEGLKLVLNLS